MALLFQIIYILHVETNKLVTYPIMDKHSMHDLQVRIEAETKMPVVEQDLILVTGMTPDPQKLASQCWLEPVSIFLYSPLFIIIRSPEPKAQGDLF